MNALATDSIVVKVGNFYLNHESCQRKNKRIWILNADNRNLIRKSLTMLLTLYPILELITERDDLLGRLFNRTQTKI